MRLTPPLRNTSPSLVHPRYRWLWESPRIGTVLLPIFWGDIRDYTGLHALTANQSLVFNPTPSGRGLYFSGGDNTQFLTVGDQDEWGFGTDPFTILALVHLAPDYDANNYRALNSLYQTSGDHRSWMFYVNMTTPTLVLRVNHTNGTSGNSVYTGGTTALQAGRVYLLGATRQGQTYKVFVNGGVEGERSDGPATIYSDSTPVARVGNVHANNGYTWDGEIIYNVVVRGYCASEGEMAALVLDAFGLFRSLGILPYDVPGTRKTFWRGGL